MKPTYTQLIFVLTLTALLLAACNMPQEPQEPAVEEQVATLAAATLDAQLSAVPPTPQASPTLAMTETPEATITPTYSLPLLTVNEDTNCRSGPGQDFEIVTVLRTGKQAEILGRSTSGNYWVIKNPDSGNPCWIWGEYAVASGSFQTLPSMTPPPTAAPSLPAAPSNLRYTFSCAYNGTGSDVTTALEWNDNARNEKGYRIYQGGKFVVELPANSTYYTEVTAIALGAKVTYSVEAFNDTGPSPQASISFSCQ